MVNIPNSILQAAKTCAETPTFLYEREYLEARAKTVTGLQLPYGFTPRFAVKANPHPEIIGIFDQAGMSFDASSDYEVYELIEQGIVPSKISLSSQQPARDYQDLVQKGVQVVATSLLQLDQLLAVPEIIELAVRINPDLGHGGTKRTTTGGVGASFGIWHEYLSEVLERCAGLGVKVTRLHVHVGSGFDPGVWGGVMDTALSLVEKMPDVTTLDIGGGFKVARVEGEHEADMVEIAAVFSRKLEDFASTTGRKLALEIEPGTWMVANAGYLLATAVDVVDTGNEGHHFIKLDTGMNDILRPSLYGAQHPIWSLSGAMEKREYIVVGHNCESGDILTPAPGDPEGLMTRTLPVTKPGDKVLIGGAGAYCASMRAHGYNAFPSAGEMLI